MASATMTTTTGAAPAPDRARGIVAIAAQGEADLLHDLGVAADRGLAGQEAARGLELFGPNAVSSHRARFLPVLWHQLRSPLLALLSVAAIASYLVGERSDAVIIGVILALSVGLGFVNEYRAEKAAEAPHSQIRHQAVVLRVSRRASVDVRTLVPGDVVELRLGDMVPADVRLLDVTGLECDESVLSGESLPVEKRVGATPPGTPLAELTGCALMGTVVHGGSGRGVSGMAAEGWRSSATASTTRWPCTPPTSGSPWTRPPTSPRTQPT